MPNRPLLAAIDAGGTTFKLGIASPDGRFLADGRIPTTSPEETTDRAAEALRRMADEAGEAIERFGVAAFGPVDIDPGSDTYGSILETPKAGWAGASLLRVLEAKLGAPGQLDTDVNAALEAEMADGAAKGAQRAAYVTVGTGVGVGVKANGVFAGAPHHPELGHVRVARHRDDEGFGGVCPFHGDCLEGLAAAPALMRRFGPLEALSPGAPAWSLLGYYLAQLSVMLVLGYRVERIVFGGGVLNAPGVIGAIVARHGELMAGYVTDQPADRLIRLASNGDRTGLHGALAVARRGLRGDDRR